MAGITMFDARYRCAERIRQMDNIYNMNDSDWENLYGYAFWSEAILGNWIVPVLRKELSGKLKSKDR
jgi:hypothetical protein